VLEHLRNWGKDMKEELDKNEIKMGRKNKWRSYGEEHNGRRKDKCKKLRRMKGKKPLEKVEEEQG
jgi:hypothetical protein